MRALVLLEGGGDSLSEALSPEMADFGRELADRIRAAVAERGPEAASEALLRGVLGDAGYEVLPEGMKARMAANGPAILAEAESFKVAQLDPARLREITCPVLVVAAASSPPAFRQLSEALAAALPDGRLVLVEGGHIISPADPHVVSFIQEVLAED